MRLSEILKPQNIKVPLSATNKTDAITELVALLASNGDIVDERRVLESVLEREATRTTGIGSGLAIPHGKTPGTTDLVMAIGRPAQPIDFQSIDMKPVTVIWLLVSPPDKTNLHIGALARISKLMMGERFRHTINTVPTAAEIFETIVKQESQM